MTKKQPESPSLRIRAYAKDLGDEGYLISIFTVTSAAPAKGRAVSVATWYHATLAKILMERYNATQKRAILTVIRDADEIGSNAHRKAYSRVKRALEELNAGGGHPQSVPEPVVEKAAKLL